MSGSELAKAKEIAAQKMREKQAAGTDPFLNISRSLVCSTNETEHTNLSVISFPLSSRRKEGRRSSRC
jgi:hypothetical protein